MFGRFRRETARGEISDRANTAYDLARQALALAERAKAADLPALAYLLEVAAMEGFSSSGPGETPVHPAG